MSADNPSSVLFACNFNAVRSPMAEGMMKKYYGTRIFVQSVGVRSDHEIDGFSVAVCAEIGIDISNHKCRSFDEMEDWGDDIDSYDLVIALSPASQRRALEYTRVHALEVEYWPTLDPTDMGQTREEKMDAYRQVRDLLSKNIIDRFGPPNELEE